MTLVEIAFYIVVPLQLFLIVNLLCDIRNELKGENDMDLISRAWLKEAIHNFFNGLSHKVTEEDIQRYIEVAPSAFEGMTNGEVIQALFPNASVYEHGSTYSINNEYNFNSTWWNAPYKGVSE